MWLGGCALGVCSALIGVAPGNLLAAAAVTPGKARSAAQFLPLFPLAVVAFPGELVLLHIYEPRYRQLIAESAESGMSFGIVTIVPGGASSIGTEMKLERIMETDASGNMNIATRGLRVFQLERFQSVVEAKLYSGGQVVFGKNSPRFDPDIQEALVQLYNRSQRRSDLGQLLIAPYPENLSFLIGHDVGLSRAQELKLLSLPAEYDRQAYLLQHLLQSQ